VVKAELVGQIVRIILKHAKPDRIYLHGSQADGSAKKGSDIDIAYDNPNFHDNSLIQNEIDLLQTLVKVDVTNIAFSDPRFRDRIRSSGRVLYSANKKLRAEDALYNFTNALDRFVHAVGHRESLAKDGYGDLIPDVLVKRFEFTFETSWKAIKRYLDYAGIEASTPRTAFKEAYAQGLISGEAAWLDMIEQRNLSSHVYDESGVSDILEKAERYRTEFEALKQELERRLSGEA
jgi:nucleotidyltransferase substrate binding protein (TIGR01987 family)